MLTDDLLKTRYADHLDDLILLAEKELERTKPEPQYHRLAEMYHNRFLSLRHTWRCHEGNLVSAFRRLQDQGGLEVITSTATHAFFPLMDRNWAALRAQVHTAAELYEKHFGRRSAGMWLGECGYVPGVDELLREVAIRYFFVDSHAILYADRRPVYGVYAPIYCATGVAAFGRDTESSEQVWSAKHGYPGDPHYRDFYRDIGFDLPPRLHRPAHPPGRAPDVHRLQVPRHHARQAARQVGLRPGRRPRQGGAARLHFRGNMEKQAQRLAAGMDRRLSSSALRRRAVAGTGGTRVRSFCPISIANFTSTKASSSPSHPASTWTGIRPTSCHPGAFVLGLKGYGEQWVNESNAWTWRHIHAAGERMVELARRHWAATNPLTVRALKQAARELMLAQASDWTFIMATGTTVPYATRRFNEHIVRFTRLYEDLTKGAVDEPYLASIEAQDNIFPDIDYRIYAT